MRTAFFALSLFSFSIVTHWLLWRIRLPTRQTRALMGWLLFGAPIVFAAAMRAAGSPLQPRSPAEVFTVGMFHVSWSLAYIVTYSALEERSPTLAIVQFVAAAGPRGRSKDEIRAVIGDSTLFESRLDAARRDGLVSRNLASLELTGKGKRVARMFAFYRRILGTGKGR